MRKKPSSRFVNTFHNAVWKRDVEKVRKILESQPKIVNTKDEIGCTALYLAVWSGDLPMTRLLLESQADPNAKTDLLPSQPGGNINSGDCNTALHLAVGSDTLGEIQKDMIKLLLEYGADVNATDGWGLTPLQRAAEKGWKDIAALLLDRGASLNAAGGKGWDIEKHRENLNGEELGWTPLHWAVGNHNKEIVELLLARGADVTARDKTGRTPLRLAMERKDELIRDLLGKAGAPE